jgi:hypothetical protein
MGKEETKAQSYPAPKEKQHCKLCIAFTITFNMNFFNKFQEKIKEV